MPKHSKVKTNNLKIAIWQCNPTLGDLKGNSQKILEGINKAKNAGADMVLCPEMAITGYPPEDLLLKAHFIQDNIAALKKIAQQIKDIVVICGFVNQDKRGHIYNAAAVIHSKKVQHIYHKICLPNYGVFDEKRYFKSGDAIKTISIKGSRIALSICEDIWPQNNKHLKGLKQKNVQALINLSASPYHYQKHRERLKVLSTAAKTLQCPIVYTNLVGGQDELVFDGRSCVMNARGQVIAEAKSFSEDLLITTLDHGPRAKHSQKALEALEALVLGVKDYVRKNRFKKVVLGLSGGIDSALVLAIAVRALGASSVIAVTMPSSFSSKATKKDAMLQAKRLGVCCLQIPIQDLLQNYLNTMKTVFKDTRRDITEENLQARIRGNILMALSNKFGYLVLTTGNKSEMATGYSTLYGDMAGGFAVLKDVPKMMVYDISKSLNRHMKKEIILESIISRPPTAELRHDQKDEDTLPPYSILDKILSQYVEEDKPVSKIHIKHLSLKKKSEVIRRVDLNEYKRRQGPIGIKITPKAFGRDRRMPITNQYKS